METNTMALIQTCQIEAIMTVQKKAVFLCTADKLQSCRMLAR